MDDAQTPSRLGPRTQVSLTRRKFCSTFYKRKEAILYFFGVGIKNSRGKQLVKSCHRKFLNWTLNARTEPPG